RYCDAMNPQFATVLSSDSRVPAGAPENDVELTSARTGTAQYDIRLDEWTKQVRLFVAAPVVSDRREPLGFVQLSVPMAPLYAAMQQTWLSLFGIAGAILLVTVIASAVLARQIAVPVQNLTATSEQIAAGRLDERVAPGGPGEIRRMGVAFNRMAERVQEMIGQQRAFVDNAAHELRTPLTSLRLRLEMLRTHGRNDPELTERYLAQMERDVGFLQRLVDHLLALATVEEGAEAPRMSLEPARLLHELADALAPLAQQEGVQLVVDVPDHLTRLRANPEQMAMLVRNLLDNAIKYAHGNGTVTLAARQVDSCLEISVADTGAGIPPDALPHIFDRFYRVDRARSRREGGVGLGLSLVRSIAEANGGRVEVNSRVGEEQSKQG
ncbi:MAG: HAMP domain-containing histidine kinase, partial [Chloroflexi bacterium]|nr:HAMP domain-containing histidine kinase [Chloroflexota bacterium]